MFANQCFGFQDQGISTLVLGVVAANSNCAPDPSQSWQSPSFHPQADSANLVTNALLVCADVTQRCGFVSMKASVTAQTRKSSRETCSSAILTA
jgi:hypothetical protein